MTGSGTLTIANSFPEVQQFHKRLNRNVIQTESECLLRGAGMMLQSATRNADPLPLPLVSSVPCAISASTCIEQFASLLITGLQDHRITSHTTIIHHRQTSYSCFAREENASHTTMVKFYESKFSYDYSFPAVSLAYFLRYPNPYSTHVSSTDVVERSFDPETQRLTTTRLHLKKSRIPSAVLKLIPRAKLGAAEDGSTQSFILERSTVDVKEGWMTTESRNLDWGNVLSVIEKQVYRRPALGNPTLAEIEDFKARGVVATHDEDKTDVTTTVIFQSRIGEQLRKRRQRWGDAPPEEVKEKTGFFKSWTTGTVQRAIETIGLQRAEGSQPKAKQGMTVVLERLRKGGLVGVLEGMRKDRELMLTKS